ncbi:mannose-1-phosphate guanylyltransferase/mannose-6-phosphate isomerase [Comamonas aquatica]|uniref:mannose-1-phosphate guanylyltransferase n=1 Tax=Comamonas aquatica TaxID=225991 RepID=A0AA42W7C0_9BURK|nr:mannose-1-phosphate guanylyltransferase/mannose-6-phosphate isomerase [Comamonas aquatica]MDH1429852.1 mannose-1-phosphate guanylyltransferase/mannose-6-phosphate isomerase [Comamonas aquatica]MDH1607468.1 mannose-1-phosphate guanylyltransferase/mannose-6-phosphate isomerase [Comamonas aquatica]MDH1619218.1 mannose-1-phosphate guanylyltransferase/mannose-6-phosphate isomerase [Comamonas aquatica]MDH2007201.1 mannose-1-phosphate guanylyltransferase/mannose-6-phosphate isomerase [Comamonas aqu
MKSEKLIQVSPVILCGGSGTRLWPLSRTGFPKQFLCLTGNESLFQQAALRLANLGNAGIQVASPIIVTGEDHRFLAAEQLREIGVELGCALLEPLGRNTAPALTLAALEALEGGADPVLVVTPADQTVTKADAFTSAMQQAVTEAAKGTIVILGVTPDKPETGYGYIQVTQAEANACVHAVRRFVEKPDANTAQAYLNEGGYYWNAGMFVLRASVWLKVLEQFRPDILQATQAAWDKRNADNTFVRPGKAEFAVIPSESVDYAAMEHCPGSNFPIKMVPLDAGWNDLGAWDAVWNVLPKDEAGNAHLGDVLTTDSRNTLAYATSRLVSLVGVENLIVVETPDAVLVADKTCSQDVKHIVTQLQKTKRQEHTLHRKVHRPWGWYDSIDEGDRFKVKRIQVKPKASLSLQKHHHRAEHWIVVTGAAEITNGDKVLTLTENQSTYIPLGEVHRLANPGTIPLEIIEVQSGSYLGEDDIVRFEDTYGRK